MHESMSVEQVELRLAGNVLAGNVLTVDELPAANS